MNSNVFVRLSTVAVMLAFNIAVIAQSPPPSGTTSQDVDAADASKGPDGILKAQGSIHFRKNGQLTLVTHEVKLSEGITARPNGEITLQDGRKIMLQEGQLVTLDGKIQAAKRSTGSTATAPTTLRQRPELQDRGNQGDDLQEKAKVKQQQ